MGVSGEYGEGERKEGRRGGEREKDEQASRAWRSVRPVRRYCFSRYSYPLSAKAPTETTSVSDMSQLLGAR